MTKTRITIHGPPSRDALSTTSRQKRYLSLSLQASPTTVSNLISNVFYYYSNNYYSNAFLNFAPDEKEINAAFSNRKKPADKDEIFIKAAMQQVPPLVRPHHPPYPSSGIIRESGAFNRHTIDAAINAGKAFNPSQSQTRFMPKPTDVLRSLHLFTDSEGRLRAKVEVLASHTASSPPNVEILPIGAHPPDNIKLALRPTIAQTATLYGLDHEQLLPFVLAAEKLLLGSLDKPLPPLRLALMGKAGTGKSKVLTALLWLAFQHDKSQSIAVLSYTWRAVLHISTRNNMGVSTTTFFGIDMFSKDLRITDKDLQKLYGNLNPEVHFIFVDEIGFIDCHHFSSMHEGAVLASSSDGRLPSSLNDAFGRFDMLCTGDFLQHQPIGGEPLFSPLLTVEQILRVPAGLTPKSMLKRKHRMDCEQAGRLAWRQFDDVIILRNQHRVTADEDGQRLLALQDTLESEHLTKEQVKPCIHSYYRAIFINYTTLLKKSTLLYTF